MDDITELIEMWLENPANNALEPGSQDRAFAGPLVGFAAGDDPLFTFLKEDIGADFYWTPAEAFAIAYPGKEIRANDLSVIAWILPQTRSTRRAQREAVAMPSIEWSKARHFGEQVNEGLRRHLVDLFTASGYQAFAPVLLPAWSRAISLKYGFASSWSERHAAHVCGLGTFGLSDGLITRVGKAIRVGSVVVRKNYSPTPRTYSHHNEWCLFHATGKCQACMRRCPAGAISAGGHDKTICKAYIRNVTALHVEQHQLGVKVSSCGLCQARVPCENRNPTERSK